MDEVTRLKAENAALREALAKSQGAVSKANPQLARRIERLERENAVLVERINVLLAKRYGPSSERTSDEQLSLFNEAEADVETEDASDEAAVADSTTSKPRPNSGKRALPADLPRIEVRHELDDAERVCPHDGAELTPIGEDTTEQLDIIPAKVRVLRHIQVKYACPKCDGHTVTAEKPKSPIPGSQVSPGLLAHVAVSKYLDHWPLYRQGEVFERMGAVIHRSTMSRWMVKSGELLQPLVNLVEDQLLESPVVQMDETPVQVLKEPGKAAESQSFMWVRVGTDKDKPAVLFDYDPSRSKSVPLRLLAGFTGTLQVDGYAGYDAAIGEYGLISAGCWAHARRRFDEVLKAAGINPKKPPPKKKPPPAAARKAAKALQYMKALFAIEHRIRDNNPDERQHVRDAESQPIVEKLRHWLDDTRPKVTPKSKLGEALKYLDDQWPRLIVFLDNGHVEMTNNRAENEIRPFAVGRKNWLFSDTQAGAKASANLYSLLMSAKRNQLEPYGYLRHLFEQLPNIQSVDDFEPLLPWNVNALDILDKAL